MQELETKKITIDAINPEPEKIALAAKFIKDGKVVVFPTETVYGMGANAFDEEACSKIFKIKGRPSKNPLIVTVSSLEMAEAIAVIPSEYRATIRRIWPSPITFIAKVKEGFPSSVTAGLDTIAIRMPAHPVPLKLIEKNGVPIVGPSANPSGRPTATSASQVIKYFDGKVDCIIDSGKAFFGIESTIIGLEKFEILRPGPFTPEEIKNVFGKMPLVSGVTEGKRSAPLAVSPGTKYKHYAPETPLFMYEGKPGALAGIIDNIEDIPMFVFIGSTESCRELADSTGCSTIELGNGSNLYEIAKNLYDAIIALDSVRVKFGIIEAFSERGIGLAIMNRMRKACSHKSFSSQKALSRLLSGIMRA